MDLKTLDVTNRVGIHAAFDTLLDCQGTKELSQRYDNIASEYDRVSDGDCYCAPAQTAAKILQIEPNKKACILDVGGGTGLVGKAVWGAGYRNLHGVDMSENSLNVAREKGVYSKLVHATFGPEAPLGYNDGFFDVAFSTGCFLPNHLDHTHLPEMLRLVKKGGYLLIITRKAVFENGEWGMKFKTTLLHLVETKKLEKIFHDDVLYQKDVGVTGVALCYKILATGQYSK